jgi:hypothetical protein
MTTEPDKQLDVRFFLLLILAAYVSNLFHELGHWSVGELLGNEMAYSLNYAWPKSGGYVHPSDSVLASLGGPAFSIVQSLMALLIIEKYIALNAYPFAFFPMFNRYFSLVLGGFEKQDEARIAVMLGMWKYLVAEDRITRRVVVSLIYTYLEPTLELQTPEMHTIDSDLARSLSFDIALIYYFGQVGLVIGPRMALDSDFQNVFVGLHTAILFKH